MRRLRCIVALLWLVVQLGGSQAGAHIGAPDVYLKTVAGPYNLLVAIHPPATVPGAASIDIRTGDEDIGGISVDGTALQRFPQEQIFSGSLWLETSGARQVAIRVSGQRGEAQTTISIPATGVPEQQAGPPANRFILWGGAFLCLICLAMLRRRGPSPIVAAILPGIAILLVVTGFLPARKPAMQLTLRPHGRLQLTLPGRMDDLVEDHGKLMHLFLIRQPQMDVLLHLHPVQTAPGRFEVDLPSMAPGAFSVFADVVHRGGIPQTLTANAGLPLETGHVLAPDDSIGIVPPLGRATPGATTVRLMDGYTMSLTLAAPLHPRIGQLLRFTLRDAVNQPPTDMQLYLGMSAHAVVIRRDASVFAHIHPDGTGPMSIGMPMSFAPASEVTFPLGFPTAGLYRVFVQMKHGATIETAAFDLNVQ